MSLNKVDNLLLFKSIVDAGSMSSAARECNISVSQASKRMSYLESTLGVQLLQRSTRKLNLTPVGESLYQKLNLIKEQIDDAWQSVLDHGQSLKGDLKIAAPITYGTDQLMPIIHAFKSKHPQINVSVELTNNEDPEKLHADICIQSHLIDEHGLPPDSNHSAKAIASERLVYVASHHYLTQHGSPESPADLIKHRCLGLKDEKSWCFKRGDQHHQQSLETEFSANNFKTLHHATVAGLGIARLPESLVHEHDGLTILFTDYETKYLKTYAYYQAGKRATKKVESFLNELLG